MPQFLSMSLNLKPPRRHTSACMREFNRGVKLPDLTEEERTTLSVGPLVWGPNPNNKRGKRKKSAEGQPSSLSIARFSQM